MNNIITSFSVSDKATVAINNSPATSEKTAVNLSATEAIRLRVTAENGTYKDYWILARNGNSAFDNAVYNMMKHYNIPGTSLAATKDEILVYSAGYGFAEAESHTRVTPNMLFRLASVSKQQTALCIMTLYEEGKLKLTDRVFGTGGILADEFKETAENPFVAGATSVTVKNFLEHNSGWEDEGVFDVGSDFAGKNLNERIDYFVHHIAMTKSVGSKYQYCNMGFCILGKVIEKITGKTFETYLREVLAKAGVTDVWVDKSSKAEKRSNEVVFYSQASGGSAYHNDMTVVSSCGAIIASAPELMQIMCSEDYGTVIPDILKPATLNVMYTASASYERYALGWRVNYPYFTNWASYHGGNLAGTGTLWVRGKKGVNAVILCNSRSYDDYSGTGFDDALYDIIGTVFSTLGD